MKPLYKYFPLFVALLILSIASIGFYGGSVVRSIFFDRLIAELENTAVIIKKQLMFEPSENIDTFCKTTGTDHSRITVIDAAGEVIGDSKVDAEVLDDHSNRPEIAEAYQGATGTAIRHSDTLERKLVYLALPAFDLHGEKVVLRIATPFTPLSLDLRGAYSRIALAGAVILVLLTSLGFIFTRRTNDALYIIQHAVQEYADGNLTFRPLVRKPPALKEVADTISYLAGDLHSRINEVSRQRDELETIFSGMEEAVIVLDTKLLIREMNHAARMLTEFPPAEAAGKDLLLVFRNSELHKIAEEVLAGKSRVEGEIVHFSDSERHLQVHGSIIPGDGEMESQLILVLNDVSRLKELERVRRDFVANVSHELKTPITAVKGYVETVIEGECEDRDTSSSFLQIALQHIDRLSAIVEDLLVISRLEKDPGMAPDRATCDVDELLRGVVSMYQQRAADRKVSIDVKCPDGISVEVNRVLMEQAIANLVDNALKYSNEGGEIAITVAADDDSISIQITDHGPGIPEEHLERIFERFYRVDKGRSRDLGGTGLGLSIVKHIANTHGGRVTVESAEGEGSTFAIVLPRT